MWRSPVARIVRDDEAAGSNPATPTIRLGRDSSVSLMVNHIVLSRMTLSAVEGPPFFTNATQTDIKQSMSIQKLSKALASIFRGAGWAVVNGLGVLKAHPQILIYPYLAALFILLTFPVVNGLVFKVWDEVAHSTIFTTVNDSAVIEETPRFLRILFGLVAFSVFYTIFVAAYFTTAMAASTLANLDKKPTTWYYGLAAVGRHFGRVTKFALIAIFFFPLSIIAQRHKPVKELPGVIGSSLSLNMAQMAPAMLSTKQGVIPTIRQAVDTLGSAWKENLVIKVGLWIVIFAVLSAGFLPQFVQEHWVDADSAQLVGALTTILLSFVVYVVTKVIGSVFTATLYHQSSNKKKNT